MEPTITINNDEYSDEEYAWLTAHWGMRVGESCWLHGAGKPTKYYINNMRSCLSQQEFTQWHLWKFPAQPNKRLNPTADFDSNPKLYKQLGLF